MSSVFWSPSTIPREVIISHTYSPAPCSAHSRRYAAFVMPAIGASTTGVSIVRLPSFSMRLGCWGGEGISAAFVTRTWPLPETCAL